MTPDERAQAISVAAKALLYRSGFSSQGCEHWATIVIDALTAERVCERCGATGETIGVDLDKEPGTGSGFIHTKPCGCNNGTLPPLLRGRDG